MLAISPDGRSLAYVAAGADGNSQIWIRRFNDLVARAVPGTDDATFPFWSPNGRSLGFFSRGALKRVDLGGGPSRVLADAPDACGGAWSVAGIILFAPRVDGVLKRISEEGGEPVDATQLDASLGQTSHRWPRFIGDGSRFLYFARAGNERSEGIYLASLESGTPRLLARSGFGGEFLPPNRLLYISEGTLLAQPFDVVDGRVSGDPMLVADRVAGSSNFYAAFSVSPTGALAYASTGSVSELTWFDRQGQRLSTVGPRGAFVDFRLSPDNQHVAVAETDVRTGHPDLFVLDVNRGTRERLTSSRASDGTPAWSPDGQELLFRSNRETVHDLYRRAPYGTTPERPFLKSGRAKYPTSWSRTGGTVLFHSLAEGTGWDIWAAPTDGRGSPTAVIQTRFDEAQAQFSPDGQWIAYAAEEDDGFEVYVERFTGGGRRWRISVAGGSDPRWNADGSELFYVAADRWLMSVPLATRGDRPPGTPQRLFQVPDIMLLAPYASMYDVASDGDRFLVRVPLEDLRTLPLTVVINWRPPAVGAATAAQ
jgi:Tol biopolymer transport system component